MAVRKTRQQRFEKPLIILSPVPSPPRPVRPHAVLVAVLVLRTPRSVVLEPPGKPYTHGV